MAPTEGPAGGARGLRIWLLIVLATGAVNAWTVLTCDEACIPIWIVVTVPLFVIATVRLAVLGVRARRDRRPLSRGP